MQSKIREVPQKQGQNCFTRKKPASLENIEKTGGKVLLGRLATHTNNSAPIFTHPHTQSISIRAYPDLVWDGILQTVDKLTFSKP